ncbi:hypothetical protein LguiB_026369 [Lonicera macranthoides]
MANQEHEESRKLQYPLDSNIYKILNEIGRGLRFFNVSLNMIIRPSNDLGFLDIVLVQPSKPQSILPNLRFKLLRGGNAIHRNKSIKHILPINLSPQNRPRDRLFVETINLISALYSAHMHRVGKDKSLRYQWKGMQSSLGSLKLKCLQCENKLENPDSNRNTSPSAPTPPSTFGVAGESAGSPTTSPSAPTLPSTFSGVVVAASVAGSQRWSQSRGRERNSSLSPAAGGGVGELGATSGDGGSGRGGAGDGVR